MLTIPMFVYLFQTQDEMILLGNDIPSASWSSCRTVADSHNDEIIPLHT